MENILFFLAGMIVSILVAFFLLKFYKRFKQKVLNRFYTVSSFSTIPLKDGTYQMDFYLIGSVVAQGYTKKCPPNDVSVQKLKVKIRSYNIKRGKYRVFWQVSD